MLSPLSPGASSRSAGRDTEVGIVLVEVLVAILAMGTGLLSVLTLLPLGAAQMADAIQDDRTAAVAAEAIALSRTGNELFSQTADFVESSLAVGSVDSGIAAQLREAYDDLARRASCLEIELEPLQSAFPSEEIQRYLGQVLADIRSIRLRIVPIVRILSLLESPT